MISCFGAKRLGLAGVVFGGGAEERDLEAERLAVRRFQPAGRRTTIRCESRDGRR